MRMNDLNGNLPSAGPKPSFFPPLYLQRRAFILQLARAERVRSIVELGCGEGSILSAFCQPAAHLDDIPSDLPLPDTAPTSRSREIYENLLDVPPPRDDQLELHLRRVAGLDINREAIDQAVRITAPQPTPPLLDDEDELYGSSSPVCRWEKLKVELWQGSLDVFNESLDDYECFVASEVVEHLHPGPLSQFGRAVLGTYRPRLVIVTTPNYDFHPYFPRTPAATGEQDQPGFPDPTGRTDRIFRNADHKFELTGNEFTEWCNELADAHDYEVTFSGVGDLKYYRKDLNIPQSKDPLYATQIAVFRRVFAYAPERTPRSPRVQPLAFYSPPEKQSFSFKRHTEHRLIKAHFYEALKEAGQPQEPEMIRAALIDVFQARGHARANLRELWGRTYVSKKCGGRVGALLQAVAEDPEEQFDLEVLSDATGVDAIDLIFKGQLDNSDDDGEAPEASDGSDEDQEEAATPS